MFSFNTNITQPARVHQPGMIGRLLKWWTWANRRLEVQRLRTYIIETDLMNSLSKWCVAAASVYILMCFRCNSWSQSAIPQKSSSPAQLQHDISIYVCIPRMQVIMNRDNKWLKMICREIVSRRSVGTLHFSWRPLCASEALSIRSVILSRHI